MIDTDPVPELVGRLLQGNRRAAGRIVSMLEAGGPRAEDIVRAVYPHTGRAHVVGMTGPPGAGKSTVVDELLCVIRSHEKTVGVLAVDPNSPFSGGAILGDRVRMMRHATDRGVFIRSMGARGHLGGLALAAENTLLVMDAMGFDVLIAETVGVGQSELEVAGTADTSVVVIPPGLGDGVQAIKAGIMEIADIFVVNKSDHPQAGRTVADIRDLLRMETNPRPWVPPIVQTIAIQGEGLEDLWIRVQQHQQFLRKTGLLEERRRLRSEREILEIAEQRLREEVLTPRTETPEFRQILDDVVRRHISPYDAAETLVPRMPAGPGK